MSAPKLTLRYMRGQDLNQVVAMDKASFDAPWSMRSYHFEVHESQCSFMAVLEVQAQHPAQGFKRLVSQLRGIEQPTEVQKTLVGYGGLWKIEDESHISTIASHPDYRGRGYGELVLCGMLLRAIALGAAYTVLEVRVSNHVAQRLYRKYGFEVVATKHNYYHNNNEDAYDMRLQLDADADVRRIRAFYEAVQARTPFNDQYSFTSHPRLGR